MKYYAVYRNYTKVATVNTKEGAEQLARDIVRRSNEYQNARNIFTNITITIKEFEF